MNQEELKKQIEFIEEAGSNELAIVRQNDTIITLLNEISNKLDKKL